MTTMDEKYGDGSHHQCCPTCGLCLDCNDCQCESLDMFTRNGEHHQASISWNKATIEELTEREKFRDAVQTEIDQNIIEQIKKVAKELL